MLKMATSESDTISEESEIDFTNIVREDVKSKKLTREEPNQKENNMLKMAPPESDTSSEESEIDITNIIRGVIESRKLAR